jgi:hypothetical protein
MRRNAAWLAILLVVAVLAVPAAAIDRAAPTAISGTVINAATGLPFSSGTIGVDVFNVATMVRKSVWVTDPDGHYTISGLDAGTYKVRFRVVSDAGSLIRYRWNDNKANFDAATPVVVPLYSTITVNASLAVLRGAEVSGTVSEQGTGAPLGGDCFYVELFEASGISLGILFEVAADGSWDTAGKVPAGKLAALAAYSVYPSGCESGPTHLDTWRGGASGYPLHASDLSADPAAFATAGRFTVVNGVALGAVNIAMLPAPTCRGKAPTIFGTTLADTINGTAARDIISGLSGADTINGLGGNDLLCGDAGNDSLTGGAGTDTGVGGPGTDACNVDNPIGCEITP